MKIVSLILGIVALIIGSLGLIMFLIYMWPVASSNTYSWFIQLISNLIWIIAGIYLVKYGKSNKKTE